MSKAWRSVAITLVLAAVFLVGVTSLLMYS
jgi:hypothetical protein